MPVKPKSAPKAPPKRKCQVGCHRSCNGVALRHMTGVRKGDPKFWICMGCHADLKRQGVRMKEVV